MGVRPSLIALNEILDATSLGRVNKRFDVIVVGGGLAGSALAGTLANGGLDVLLIERDRDFRDRIRGEFTWPWGRVEATRLGLEAILVDASAIELPTTRIYHDRAITKEVSVQPVPMVAYSHPRLQEALWNWAESTGVTTMRPAKAIDFDRTGTPSITVSTGDGTLTYRARLIVGADGNGSGVRRWIGAKRATDPEHHRFGGLLVSAVNIDPPSLVHAPHPATACICFPIGRGQTRVYLRMSAELARQTHADRSTERFLDTAGSLLPEGLLASAQVAGPLGFFSNSNTWSSRLAGKAIVLIGDAAGSADPSLGHGTSLLFRDVRVLSELLLSEEEWPSAIAEFERQRLDYYSVIRAKDRWYATISAEEGPEADRRREQQDRAAAIDPTLGGFGVVEFFGPDGLVADEAHRRAFFGESDTLDR